MKVSSLSRDSPTQMTASDSNSDAKEAMFNSTSQTFIGCLLRVVCLGLRESVRLGLPPSGDFSLWRQIHLHLTVIQGRVGSVG
jgi:hypothetical protein